ncbi:50S ribosomal protein L19 [Candidatus Kaiserbacteria bacterium]|nr:50S ribosomal protein L19 [Candidatus Kaiserbacteria bacterium]
MNGITVSPVNMESRKKLGIRSGDTVAVHQKIEDKGKTRIQVFEGLVLARKHGIEPGATFTVRKVSGGIGVEKIFPLYSPMIDKIEITRRSKMRRAKLYYIREKVAREIKRQMRRMHILYATSETAEEAMPESVVAHVSAETEIPAATVPEEDVVPAEVAEEKKEE